MLQARYFGVYTQAVISITPPHAATSAVFGDDFASLREPPELSLASGRRGVRARHAAHCRSCRHDADEAPCRHIIHVADGR